MKKLLAILMTLCLMCAACCAMADMEIPLWENMPGVIMEDDDTVVDEAAFQGEWVLNVAFLGTTYLTEQELSERFDYNFMPFIIADGKVMQDYQQENGEFITLETEYTFESGQLQGEDGRGTGYAIELLEDGNIVLSVFFPGEDDVMQCLSLFLKHPEE